MSGTTALLVVSLLAVTVTSRPNIVVLYADDLGYGDLPAYGHPTSVAPNLDMLFSSGVSLTQFYSTSPVCSPSRASLLTGRYQTRSGIWPGVFGAGSVGGLPHSEITLSELLQSSGYSTAHIGKWHLGVGANYTYLPHHHGFDTYFGIPYSHDMCPCYVCFFPHQACYHGDVCRPQAVPCPIMHVFNKTVTIAQQPADFTTLNEQYTRQAVNFISDQIGAKKSFFLYFAFHHIHHPQFSGEMFRNKTYRGDVGDSLAEMDWSVGQLMSALKSVTNNTIVMFSSDNGPSLVRKVDGGNAGALRCGKGTTYEGGMRVPAVFSWPGHIPPRRSLQLSSTLDVLPTMAKLAGMAVPSNLTLDGFDLSEMLLGHTEKDVRDYYIYYPSDPNPSNGVYAVRYKQYKAHYITQGSSLSAGPRIDVNCTARLQRHNPPLLFDLGADPSEGYNINTSPGSYEILAKIEAIKEKHDLNMKWGSSEMAKGSNRQLEPCCQPNCQPFPSCCKCSNHKC